MKGDSNSARITRRMAVNRSGGISASAHADVRKFSAQATQITSTSSRSRPRRPKLPGPAELAIELCQHPGRADEQVGQVGEEARLAAFDLVADELRDPCDHEHADGQV